MEQYQLTGSIFAEMTDEMMINFFEWEPAGPEPEKVNHNRPFE